MVKYNNATQAFESLYKYISHHGINVSNTKASTCIGFYIENPMDNEIKTPWRKWKKDYAEKEWEWYLSKDQSVSEIKKHAKAWDKMHNGDDIVQSNYGWQWERNNQLQYCIDELLRDNNTRRAFITIYDGKEHKNYSHDTPCTLSIGFNITNDKLNMMVQMRSNDLWYGFCNDQYCFSKLQQHVSRMVNKQVGWYHHFVNNIHIYNDFLNKDSV
jgi:thymidylate synthase